MKGQNQRGIIFVLAIIMLASTVLCFSVFVRAEEKASVVFRIEGDAECFDYFERSLYNNILASIAEDGTHYFYKNPLVSDGSIRRWDWHGCPCCPPMLLKLYSSLATYAYS